MSNKTYIKKNEMIKYYDIVTMSHINQYRNHILAILLNIFTFISADTRIFLTT